jgi:uncharacterized protein
MELVVSDTSPIRALAHVRYLHLLQELFDDILIPPAVARELEFPDSKMQPIPLGTMPGVVVRIPRDATRVNQLARILDLGEAEAIALAVETKAEALLIDEATGRREAERLGLPTIGALGVLVRGKQRGLLPSVAPLMDQLQQEIGFRISASLREEILRRARE